MYTENIMWYCILRSKNHAIIITHLVAAVAAASREFTSGSFSAVKSKVLSVMSGLSRQLTGVWSLHTPPNEAER